jgi:16S rRNA (adenine1518-N6/adenine1519-N6)-dimethyltransferase
MKRRRRRLGQHFLSDPRIAGRIVENFRPSPSDTVVEIGAGRGALTRLLQGRVGMLYAVEVDGSLAGNLDDTLGRGPGIQVVCGDILRMDWRRFAPSTGRLRIIGNLPYAISKPLLRLFAENVSLYSDALITLQEEVASRLTARPGSRTYGAMSILVNLRCAVEPLFSVHPGAFRPPPAVWSRLLRLVARPCPAVRLRDEALFLQTVQSAFSQRRKALANSLRAGPVAGLGRQELEDAIRKAGLDPAERPERVDMEGFARLSAELGRFLEGRPASHFNR